MCRGHALILDFNALNERLESVRIGKCQNAFFFKIGKCQNGKCQNWKVSELESVKIEKCQNWKVSELESVRIGKCQNRKVLELESVRIFRFFKYRANDAWVTIVIQIMAKAHGIFLNCYLSSICLIYKEFFNSK